MGEKTMQNQMFKDLLEKKTDEIEIILRKYLPKEQGCQKTVLEAMNYSVVAGGKRLRPMLMQETYTMLGGKSRIVEPFMAAMEMIHTYSLVHDDLPSMDNDKYRRGRETTWSVYGEAMGILAGDGLLNYAFETALKSFPMLEEINKDTDTGVNAERLAEAMQVLAHKAGVYGMIGGQTADIEAEGQEESLSMEQILFIHKHKTAALIEASMMIGAILAGADSKVVKAVEKCAYNVGIAFQIQDDILDIIGDSDILGKPVGSDAENRKQTYVTIKGLEQSKKDVEQISKEAVEILSGFGAEHGFLEQLILNLIHRDK